jgi:predicted AlkP superfamily pyrophosphatase or phosphodiesterase
MGADFYIDHSPHLHIPNLQRLKREGSFAEGVVGVYPSLTYPSHTTIITGRLPAEHGIYTNLSSREPGKNPGDWFWFSNTIKVPTLWDEARQAHLSTASASWPVTVGAPIDWNIPEVWDPLKGEVGDPVYVAKFLNPLLALEMLAALGPPQPGADTDVLRTRVAGYFLKEHKPNLLLLHLAEPDHTEHRYGPRSANAGAALERVDARIGELLAVLKESGLEDSTDVFIVSDHGFLSVSREIRPNVLLVKAGLLTTDDQGSLNGGKVETVVNGGSFFIYWPESKNLRAEVEAALKPMRDQGLLWAEFDRQALRELGADPGAQMALEAPEGSTFSDNVTGDLVGRWDRTGGNHGFLPFRRGLEASFIAWGPRITRGVNLHHIRMTAIGPTLLKDMGIEDAQFGAAPALTDIFK